MIRILYFASLRERLGLANEELARPPTTVGELRAELAARGGDWAAVFNGEQPVLIAVNQEMALAETTLRDGDEVGFFPPVTGG